MKRLIPFLAAAFAVMAVPSASGADETGPPFWLTRDTLSGPWFGLRTALSDRGVNLHIRYTAEIWSNTSGGTSRGSVYTGLVEFGGEADLEKLTGWEGTTFYHSWFAPHGRDLSTEYVGNRFTVSNAAAFNSLYLYQLWVQQTFFDERFSLRIGQLAADEEFAGSDYGALFLNAAFGWPPFIAENVANVGPAFPKGAPGMRLALRPLERLTVQSALYQGDPFEDAHNPHGLRWRLGRATGWLWMNELQLRWAASGDGPGRPGGLKLGFWHQWRPDEERLITRGRNFGFYGVIDQSLRPPDADRPDAGPGWFLRAGGGPQGGNAIGFYLDTGLRWKGLLASRPDDVLGVAFAWGKQTGDEMRRLRAEGPVSARHEAVVELTCLCRLTPWFAIQPDVQWIFNPEGAVVVGARAVIAF